jgi:hypothetical protein
MFYTLIANSVYCTSGLRMQWPKKARKRWLRMAMLTQGNDQQSTQMEHVEPETWANDTEYMVDIARWKTEAKSVHRWVFWNHHIISEIRNNFTDTYINTLALQTRSTTKRQQELRVTYTANSAPTVIPLTQQFNVVHTTLAYIADTCNCWYMQARGSATRNAVPRPYIIIASSSDDSDFVDLPLKRKRQPKQNAHDIPHPRARQLTSVQGPHDKKAKNAKVHNITHSP